MPFVLPGSAGGSAPGTSSNPVVPSGAQWTLDVDEICQAAFRRIGGEQTKAYELRSAREALQFVFQRLMLRGVNLWTLDLVTTILQADQDLPITLAYDTVDILDPVYRDTQQTTVSDVPVNRMSRGEYQALPDKATQGVPVSIYLDRQRDAPKLYVWPVPNRAGYEIRYWRIKRIRDIDTMIDNVDAPVRWLPTLVAGVAWYMSLERRGQIAIAERQELKAEFEAEFAEAAGEDRENVPFTVSVDLSCYGRT